MFFIKNAIWREPLRTKKKVFYFSVINTEKLKEREPYRNIKLERVMYLNRL
jgi:hypothetical protein